MESDLTVAVDFSSTNLKRRTIVVLSPELIEELEGLAYATPANEAEVETKILLHIFRLLGYSDLDRADKPAIVMHFGRQKMTKYPDFIIYDGTERSLATALITVEAKAPDQDLEDAVTQAKSYALWGGTPFYFVCNGSRLQLFQFSPSAIAERTLDLAVCDLVVQWPRIRSFLSRATVILMKERLSYAALYLPEIERLPPREFFQEYLQRVRQRFSVAGSGPPEALVASDDLKLPHIPVRVTIESRNARECDEQSLVNLASVPNTRLLIGGSAGSGKSTLLRRIAANAAHVVLDGRGNVLPVFVRLAGGIPNSIDGAFATACQDMGVRVLPNLYGEALTRAHLLVLLDGADETDLAGSEKENLVSLLRDCGKHSLVVTSRFVPDVTVTDLLEFEDWEVGAICDLSAREVRDVFTRYLGSRGGSVLASVVTKFREEIRSPLLALMMIRVAQAEKEWTSVSRYRLFARYVEVLDEYFNAAIIRGKTGASPGRAVEDLTTVTRIMNSDEHHQQWTLETLASVASREGFDEAVTSLVNIGLLTSSGGGAQFVHQSFFDFGVARNMLQGIQTADPERVASVIPNAAASEMLCSELTPTDEKLLVRWLETEKQRVHRRVYSILRRGCSRRTLAAIRKIWMKTGLMGRLSATAGILAAHGDTEFLRGHDRHLDSTTETARSRILARVLGSSEREEYLEVVLTMAKAKPMPQYLVALTRLVFATKSHRLLPEITALYSQRDARTRHAISRLMTHLRHSELAADAIASFLTNETDPDIVLLLLYAGRRFLGGLDGPLVMEAATKLEGLEVNKTYQSFLAKKLIYWLEHDTRQGDSISALLAAFERIAGCQP